MKKAPYLLLYKNTNATYVAPASKTYALTQSKHLLTVYNHDIGTDRATIVTIL